MILPIEVNGLKEFLKEVENHPDKDIFVLFTGSDDESGKSWCPDCVRAEPVIEHGVTKAPDGSVFILCTVGDRTTWKNPESEFRTHQTLQLKEIPTLMKWGTSKKLGSDDCAKQDLVDMLFEEA